MSDQPNDEHRVIAAARARFPGLQDEQDRVAVMLGQYERCVADLAATQPGRYVETDGLLHDTRQLLIAITKAVGVVDGWTREQRVRVHQLAVELTGRDHQALV